MKPISTLSDVLGPVMRGLSLVPSALAMPCLRE